MLEKQTVERFTCPLGHSIWVEWYRGEIDRRVACPICYVEERVPQPSTDEQGKAIVIEQVTNQGHYVVATRGGGRGVFGRERDEADPSKRSWGVV